MAKRMIELNPELASRAQIYADKIVVPENDAVMIALPADPAALHGWDPSLLSVDELHVVTEAVWEAVTSMTGKRPQALTLAISTLATTPDSIMWRLVEHGRDATDPAFYLREFAAPDGCPTDDVDAWRTANPALSCERPFLAKDGLAAARRTLGEPVFRQLRLGQWVTGSDAWMPFGLWDTLKDADRVVGPKSKIVLAFDGSASGDSTALIGCTVGPEPHLFVAGLWENPATHDGGSREATSTRPLTSPSRRGTFSSWPRPLGLEVRARSVGRTARREEGRRVEHRPRRPHGPGHRPPLSGRRRCRLQPRRGPRLAAHVAQCVAKRTPLGDLVSKGKRASPRKIDPRSRRS